MRERRRSARCVLRNMHLTPQLTPPGSRAADQRHAWRRELPVQVGRGDEAAFASIINFKKAFAASRCPDRIADRCATSCTATTRGTWSCGASLCGAAGTCPLAR